jgi:hypothetical protein
MYSEDSGHAMAAKELNQKYPKGFLVAGVNCDSEQAKRPKPWNVQACKIHPES